MTASIRYFHKKSDRLTGRKKIEILFSKGKNFSLAPFRVFWMPATDDSVLQAGVGVRSAQFKRAVDRNRIKRLMREAYRLQKSGLFQQLSLKNNGLALFLLYTGKSIPEYDEIYKGVGKVIERLIKLTDESPKRDN